MPGGQRRARVASGDPTEGVVPTCLLQQQKQLKHKLRAQARRASSTSSSSSSADAPNSALRRVTCRAGASRRTRSCGRSASTMLLRFAAPWPSSANRISPAGNLAALELAVDHDRLADRHARIVDALDEQQRRLDLRDVRDRRELLERLLVLHRIAVLARCAGCGDTAPCSCRNVSRLEMLTARRPRRTRPRSTSSPSASSSRRSCRRRRRPSARRRSSPTRDGCTSPRPRCR